MSVGGTGAFHRSEGKDHINRASGSSSVCSSPLLIWIMFDPCIYAPKFEAFEMLIVCYIFSDSN